MQQRIINERYEVLDHLGSGNQGEVLLALDRKLERRVAIKLLKTAGGFDQNEQQLLRREAMVMAKFSHVNVVNVYDYDLTSDNHWPFIVMEHLRGDALNQIDPQLSDQELRSMVTQVSGALRSAHEIGLVHRDLKPANVMLVDRADSTSRFVILDLGIAKLSDCAKQGFETFGSMTFSGAGTPYYMAPEQAESRKVDHRADVYAMGIMVYEFMAGFSPFVNEANSLRSLLNAVAAKRPQHLIEVSARECSSQLNELVMQCLEKDPEKRPDSMQEFATRFLKHFKSNSQIPQMKSATSEDGSSRPPGDQPMGKQSLLISPSGTLSLNPTHSTTDQQRGDPYSLPPGSETDQFALDERQTGNDEKIINEAPRGSWFVPILAIAFTIILAISLILIVKASTGSKKQSEDGAEKSISQLNIDDAQNSKFNTCNFSVKVDVPNLCSLVNSQTG